MTQLTENVFAVEVPEDATDIVVHNEPPKIIFTSKIQDPAQCGGDMIRLPPGSWQLLCTTREVTWLQAAGIVDHFRGGFVNYESNSMPKVAAYSTPFLSLNSLLTSNGLDTNNNYCLLKKVG